MILLRVWISGAWAAVFLCLALAQPPAPPALPPINPAQARLEQTLAGLDSPGLCLATSEELGIVVAGCENGTLQFWDKDVLLGVRVGDRPPNVLKAHQGQVTALAWNGGNTLASAGIDRKIILWSMPDAKAVHTLPTETLVRALALAPGGKLLASSCDDFSVQLSDPAAGKLGAKLTGHTDWVTALCFSPDGKVLASGGYDGIVRLWEAVDGKKLLEIPAQPVTPPNTPPPRPNTVLALAFSADGKLLAAGGTDAQVHLFNVGDGKLVRSLPGHTSSVTALAFHPTGTVLASSSKDRTVRLWTPATGQALKTLEGHTSWVQGAAFVVQATRLASVGADQTVRLWDLKEPAKK